MRTCWPKSMPALVVVMPIVLPSTTVALLRIVAERQTLDAEAALGLVELDVRIEEVAAEREVRRSAAIRTRGDHAVTDVVAAALERLEAERDIVIALAVAVEVGEAVGLAEDVGARRRHRLAAARIADGDAERVVGELVDIGDAGDPAERRRCR